MKLAACAAALVLGAGFVLSAGDANAACTAQPPANHCENRSSGNLIDKRGSGGNYVACPAIPANQVQFDFYVPASGGWTYICSADAACSQLSPSSPEYKKFC